VRFWDASAIVPLLVEEHDRGRLLDALEADPVMAAWWASPVEVASAIARREREGLLSPADATSALQRLRQLERSWHQVTPTDSVRGVAQRLLRVHPLRAADSLQLAAALAIAGDDPAGLGFVCLDQRLVEAARKEGLDILVP
jgi:predicted nucleic acid-binding protein